MLAFVLMIEPLVAALASRRTAHPINPEANTLPPLAPSRQVFPTITISSQANAPPRYTDNELPRGHALAHAKPSGGSLG
jgi:hypothetical protein